MSTLTVKIEYNCFSLEINWHQNFSSKIEFVEENFLSTRTISFFSFRRKNFSAKIIFDKKFRCQQFGLHSLFLEIADFKYFKAICIPGQVVLIDIPKIPVFTVLLHYGDTAERNRTHISFERLRWNRPPRIVIRVVCLEQCRFFGGFVPCARESAFHRGRALDSHYVIHVNWSCHVVYVWTPYLNYKH